MEGEETVSDPLIEEEEEDRESWAKTTAEVIQSIEQRCSDEKYTGSVTHFGAETLNSKSLLRISKKPRPLSESCTQASEKSTDPNSSASSSAIDFSKEPQNSSSPCLPSEAISVDHVDDIQYIDESAKSSLSADLCETLPPSPPPPPPKALLSSHQRSRPFHPPSDRSCASVLEERYCQAFLGPKSDAFHDGYSRHHVLQPIPPSYHILSKKLKHESRLVVSPMPSEKQRQKKDSTSQYYSDADFYSCVSTADSENQAAHYLLDRDFRYYFQHPYSRLFVSYFVIFCNFLVFAEDPVSHSHTESEIPIVGNVFSFVATKYPPEWTWCVFKVILWIIAILGGMVFGKYLIHHIILSRVFRLKMFRDEQGTWMIMFLTSLMCIYMFSMIYNSFLLSGHPNAETFRINSLMGITNANFMKAAACGTWVGDFVTAWMVTDMMLQDNLYPQWAKPYREFWKSHGRIRITVFWTGSVVMTTLVVTLIVSDWISWDNLNRDFVATTELSRAFLASFILVMDLLIVIQDWDFPHFVCDLDIKLPGMHVASFKFNLFQKYVNIPDVNMHITGKWFNYSIIVFVMILDLNMWKNQIFYMPADYGQYIGPDHKVFSVPDLQLLSTGNSSLWTYEVRSTQIDPRTNRTLLEGDISMNSRYLGYPLSVKGMAFVPSLIGFAMFGILTYLYGRFPPHEGVVVGRKRRPKRQVPRSSWRRERGTQCTHYLVHNDERHPEKKKKNGNQLTELIVAWDENAGCTKSSEKPL